LAPKTAVGSGIDFLRRGLISQIECHQRREVRAGRKRGSDALAIGEGGGRGGHRRSEIGHDNRAREAPGREWQHSGERRAVAQVQMPVVGTANRQLLHEYLDQPARRRSLDHLT